MTCTSCTPSGNTGTSGNTGISAYVDYVLAANTPNDGSEMVSTANLPVGTYLIQVRTMVNSAGVSDWSDATFGVTAASATSVPPARQLAQILEALRTALGQILNMLGR